MAIMLRESVEMAHYINFDTIISFKIQPKSEAAVAYKVAADLFFIPQKHIQFFCNFAIGMSFRRVMLILRIICKDVVVVLTL